MAQRAGAHLMLVDTSVWVGLLRGHMTAESSLLARALTERNDVCTCGVVFTEILQGIRDNRHYAEVKEGLEALVYLPMTRDTFALSADIYRGLRSKGVTIRKSIDCMIAAVAIEHDVALLHDDRDFLPISESYPIRRIVPTL